MLVSEADSTSLVCSRATLNVKLPHLQNRQLEDQGLLPQKTNSLEPENHLEITRDKKTFQTFMFWLPAVSFLGVYSFISVSDWLG